MTPPEGIVIRPLRVEDDAEIHELYDMMRDALLYDNPERPMWSEQALMGMLRTPDDDLKLHLLVAVTGPADASAPQRMVGHGIVALPQRDNREKAFGSVCVHPSAARRGIGGAILSALLEIARSEGRSVFLSDAVYAFEDRDTHGYRRFAERHGFAVASRQVTRRLDLPVPEDRLQAWIDEAAAHHAGYRIESYCDIPDELLASVCDVEVFAVDAPSGDIEFEARQRTPAARRASRERDKASGVTVFEAVAVDQEGRAVAVSTLQVAEGEAPNVRQVGTVVHRDHRGHRLGLAVKAANLRAMQRACPDRRAVYTSNDEQNARMVQINERMGFVAKELHVQFSRPLETGPENPR